MSNTTITINPSLPLQRLIDMSEMEPLAVGRIVTSTCNAYVDRIVMRTSSSSKFEIMNLSDSYKDSCWTARTTVKGMTVELLDVELVVNIK